MGMPVNRRSALVLASAKVDAARSLDLSSPAGRLNTYMRMRGALDDSLVVGFLTGRYHGVVDGEVTPLYGLVSATVSRYRQAATGGYAGVEIEQAYYTDLETGKVLETWRNPYTGEAVTVPIFRTEPTAFTIDENLKFERHVAIPGAEFAQTVNPPVVVGKDVWFTERLSGVVRKAGGARPTFYNELTTAHARVEELAANPTKRVRADTHFAVTVSWSPWLKMGDRPGHLLGDAEGGYGVALSELPPVWLEATLRDRPQMVHDPARALDPVWSTLAGGR